MLTVSKALPSFASREPVTGLLVLVSAAAKVRATPKVLADISEAPPESTISLYVIGNTPRSAEAAPSSSSNSSSGRVTFTAYVPDSMMLSCLNLPTSSVSPLSIMSFTSSVTSESEPTSSRCTARIFSSSPRDSAMSPDMSSSSSSSMRPNLLIGKCWSNTHEYAIKFSGKRD